MQTKTETQSVLVALADPPKRQRKGKPLDAMVYSAADLEKFWRNVERKGDDECWEWIAGRSTHGYGAFHIPSVGTRTTHRVSFALHYRPLLAGEDVCHRCDNPPCVNPRHLFAGSAYDNMMDAFAKRRFRHSEENGRAILSNDEVRKIRKMMKLGIPQKAIAETFGTSEGTVSMIKLGKQWRYVQ